MEKITGKIENIRYFNESTYYTIAEVVLEDKKTTIIKGNIPNAKKKMLFTAEGNWFTDKIYGKEFIITKFEEKLPTTTDGIESYLASGMIKGIGPSMAKLIVKKFGEDTLNVIDKEPEKLLEIKGIGKKKLESIVEQIKDQKQMREIMVFLKTYDFSDNLSAKIYRAYGVNTIKKITEDPYALIDDIEGIGFKKADIIALKLGTDPNDEKRIMMGVRYVLNQAANDKDTFLPIDELIKKSSSYDILDIEAEKVLEIVTKMSDSKLLINDNNSIYLPQYHKMEREIAYMISQKSKSDMFDEIEFDEKTLSNEINDVVYSEEQFNAIKLASSNRMTVITGGPGTGKTTILKGLISIFKKHNLYIRLAAPTGRAARRMTETSGMPALTIHRLLEWQFGEFTRNQTNKLEGDVLILDETSMINLNVMHSLLIAMPERMKLIMIGDVDQLPPIGCGSILKDVIESNVVPVIKLTKIYRQDAKSKIITNAHLINNELMPDISNSKDTDFFFFNVQNPEEMKQQVVRLVTEAIPLKFNVGVNDIQVLSPMRKSADPTGATQLNIALQEKINPNEKGYPNGVYKLKVGDRVMQNSNNYDLGVFNGDIGIIKSIDNEANKIEVSFFGNDEIVTYDKSCMDEIELAYASTIHKSQGSEYPVVVMVAGMHENIMLQKQLFYTAVTRAKKICILVSSKNAVCKMVKTKSSEIRYSNLKNRISDFCNNYLLAV